MKGSLASSTAFVIHSFDPSLFYRLIATTNPISEGR